MVSVAYCAGSHLVSRGAAQHEPKVDVHDVAVRVEHDVAVVPVLDTQQVRHHRVPGKMDAPAAVLIMVFVVGVGDGVVVGRGYLW